MRVCDIRRLYYNNVSKEDIEQAYYSVDIEDRDEEYYDCTILHLAAEYGELKVISYLLEHTDIRINERDNRGYTPIMYAVNSRMGISEEQIGDICQIILNHGGSISRSAKDSTVLIEAIRKKHFIAVDKILASDLSSQKIDGKDNYGENALHVAASIAGDIACDIRRKENLKKSYEERWTPEKFIQENIEDIKKCHMLEDKCLAIISYLISSGVFDLDAKTDNDKTAFDIAIASGSKKAGALLKGLSGERAVLHGGMNLFEALYYKDNIALKAILEEGDFDINGLCENKRMYDFYGKTALMASFSWRNLEAAKLLLEAGADSNYRNLDGQSAFYSWLLSRNEASIKREEVEEVLTLMVSSGWFIDSPQDKFDSSALSLVCEHSGNDLSMVFFRFLIKKKADLNRRDDKGMTPILRLFESRVYAESALDMLEILLENGADVSVVDNAGNTILHHIADTCNKNIAVKAVQLLKDFGVLVDSTRPNNKGISAVDIAAEWNNDELLKELI